MKYWVKSKIGLLDYRDEDDDEECSNCLVDNFIGRCKKERLCVRRDAADKDNIIFCFEKNMPTKQAAHIAKITTSTHPKVMKLALRANGSIHDIETVAYHNAKKLNASIGQKLAQLNLKDKGNQQTILTLRKIVEQIEGEYNFVDILSDPGEISIKEMTEIKVHKLIVGEVYLYQVELNKRNIRVEVADTELEICVEYGISRSSIGQVLNNIIKYCRHESIVDVSVTKNGDFVDIKFEMVSQFFTNSDVSRLKKLYERGREVLNNGEGIGLYAIDLFQKKHGGYLKMKSDEESIFMFRGIQYSRNTVTLGFKHYVV
jgi:hypothetical protein